MVLLDSVESWDDTGVVCETRCHLRADNPLRVGDSLPATAGVELGGQAMAVHGALVSGGTPRPGLLVAITDLRLTVATLQDVPGVLRVRARLLRGDDRGRIYRFEIRARDGDELVSGRLTVMLVSR